MTSELSRVTGLLFLSVLTSWPAAAQFQGLITNGDGSVLYFSAPIRLKGSEQTFHSKIFRWDATGGIRVVAEASSEGQSDGCVTSSFYQLQSPQVSTDGIVFGYTASRPAPGARLCPPAETSQGVVELPGHEVRLDGTLALSLNGRYAITTPVVAVTNGFHIVTDLTSGTSSVIDGAFDGSWQHVTDSGTIVTARPSAIILTDRNGGTRVLQTKAEVNDVLIDRAGKTLVYLTRPGPAPGGGVQGGGMSSLDVASGRETLLTSGLALGSPALTSDGTTVFFTDIDSLRPDHQLYAVGLAGARRQVGSAPDQAIDAVVSGDGLVAFAVTGGTRLVRIDTTSGTFTELMPAPPLVTTAYRIFPPATTIAAAGSVMTLVGSGLTNTRQLTLCGQSIPFTVSDHGAVQVQIPWDAPEGVCRAVAQTDSPFEHGIELEVRQFDPQFAGPGEPYLHHADWRGVMAGAPAHAGETITAYMTGLGPVDDSGRLTRPGFVCLFDGAAGTVSYAGLAPGFTGFYQLNVTVPNLPSHPVTLSCGWEGSFASTTLPVE